MLLSFKCPQIALKYIFIFFDYLLGCFCSTGLVHGLSHSDLLKVFLVDLNQVHLLNNFGA